jgi:hypothetical protein
MVADATAWTLALCASPEVGELAGFLLLVPQVADLSEAVAAQGAGGPDGRLPRARRFAASESARTKIAKLDSVIEGDAPG